MFLAVDDRLDERALDLAPGHVAGVHDAARAVAALEMQVEVARPRARRSAQARARLVRMRRALRAIEARPVTLEHADAVGRLADAELDRTRVAQAGARHERVLRRAPRRSRPLSSTAAMPPCAYFVFDSSRAALGDDDDLAVIGRLERERQPGDAAADDEEVARQHWGDQC